MKPDVHVREVLARSFWLVVQPVLPLVSAFFLLFMGMLSRVSERSAFLLARWLVPIALSVFHSRRMANFRRAFGHQQLSHKQYRLLNRKHLTYMSEFVAHVARLTVTSCEEFKKGVLLEGEEHVVAALKLGRGVLLLGCHLSNWLHSLCTLSVLGYPVSTVTKQVPVRGIESFLQSLMQRFNVRSSHTGNGALQAAGEVFGNNEILGLYLDISTQPNHAVWLPCGTALQRIDIGPAILALRYGAPVLLVSCTVLHDHRTIVTITPAVGFLPVGDVATDAKQLLSLWLKMFYAEFQKRPEQWWPWSFITRTQLREG